MSRRQWTLLLVSDNDTSVRQYRFTREVVRFGIAIILLTVATTSSFITTAILKARQPVQSARLEKKNELLQAEITDIHTQINALTFHIEELTKQDEQFRLVAGLDPLSSDVQRVGIGGPGLAHAESDAAVTAADKVGELLRRARLLSFSWREARDTLAYKTERLQAMPSIIPTNGFLTSGFSYRRWHPILNEARPHVGVDISAPRGTPIVAAANGRVTLASWDHEYGYLIEVDHGFGLATRYAHASRLLVHAGQIVKRGQKIALVGETGLAVGTHLHYEVRVNGAPVDPRNYFLNSKVITD